eukprot:7515190-Pyramimonas_sp.AAC.1
MADRWLGLKQDKKPGIPSRTAPFTVSQNIYREQKQSCGISHTPLHPVIKCNWSLHGTRSPVPAKPRFRCQQPTPRK